MRPLGRRALFALPLVAPFVVTGGIAACAGSMPGEWRVKSVRRASQRVVLPDLKTIDDFLAESAKEVAEADARLYPTPANLAATLGIPHDEPRAWTDEEVALTLGIDIQRDGIAVSAMAERA